MFEGSAAQFLSILESLNDTNRRIVLTQPPASDSEVEILDVYAELFMAAKEILAGMCLAEKSLLFCGGRRGVGSF